MELLSRLLPQGAPLHLETSHLDEGAAQLTLRVTSMQAMGHCPVCRFPTRRIHSFYQRTLADLPWAHLRVVLQLRVRKFFWPTALHAPHNHRTPPQPALPPGGPND
jgi:hypothetical protein